jgi:hypothetical protein
MPSFVLVRQPSKATGTAAMMLVMADAGLQASAGKRAGRGYFRVARTVHGTTILRTEINWHGETA